MIARGPSWDLLAVIVAALLAVAVGLLPAPAAASAAIVAPLALFLPGYALVALLLPRSSLGFPERVLLGVGASIGFVALSGLLLNALRIPLDAPAWRFLLGGVTIALAGYGLWQRSQGRLDAPGTLSTRLAPRQALLFAAGALVLGLALGFGAVGTAAPAGERTAALWALPERATGHTVVHVGLRNDDAGPVTYRIAVDSFDQLVAEWPEVTLRAGEEWQAEATVPAASYAQEILIFAYRASDPVDQPYRQARVVVAADNSP